MHVIEMIVRLHSAKSPRLSPSSKRANPLLSRDVVLASISASLKSRYDCIGYDAIKAKYLHDRQAIVRCVAFLQERGSHISEPIKSIAINEAIALFCEVIPPSHHNHVLSLYRAYGTLANHQKYQRKRLIKKRNHADKIGDKDALASCQDQLKSLRVNSDSSIKRRIKETNKCCRCNGSGRLNANLYQCPSCNGTGVLPYQYSLLSRFLRRHNIKIDDNKLRQMLLFIEDCNNELNINMNLAVTAIKKRKYEEQHYDE
ncbi:hypothetical protein IHC92_17415 [Photobacterium damselae subsp. damselae]|uniref:hypothetical protein n=1 Tax=Photobacterium damselae TaxID=38293 RepID=UPI001F441858|nr:hypothetical protein [Photobacterium damselae]UKA08856.1 hypothetical protein IHC90_17780 [Photobacterium damselae subsp. damselae]UKA23941.1 hypothetical protein IHC92_17415 [Photobacterium damselae subsp. damselae]